MPEYDQLLESVGCIVMLLLVALAACAVWQANRNKSE
jgi:hypothetical protein